VAGDQGGQQVLDGMPEQLYPCTPTRLATWRDCPRRYRFTYLDRPPPARGAPWAHNSVGAATHTALAQWFGVPVAGRTPQRGAHLLRRAWLRDGFRDDAQSEAACAAAAGWVEAYLAGVDPASRPVGVERTVSATSRQLVLSGRVDRIDAAPDGSLTIVDYKTGRWVPTPDDARASLALAAYAVGAARVLRRPCTRVELHHLPTGTVAVAEHTAGSLAAAVAGAEVLGRAAGRADAAHRDGRTGDDVFPPSPSAACAWCDVRRHCPEGRAASVDVEPWAGLADAVLGTGVR
jgi:RecB family exonuclease